MWKTEYAWLLQKIVGSFPVENVDDVYTDQYHNQKPKSTDVDFAKVVLQKQFVEKHFKNTRFLIYIVLLFSCDFASLSSCRYDRFICI